MRGARGKLLGGAPPRARRTHRPPPGERERRGEILLLLGIALFFLGGLVGFGWELDRQLRGGILRQRAEAQQRSDWVRLEQLPPVLTRMVVSVVDPGFQEREAPDTESEGLTLPRDLVRQVHLLDDGLRGEARGLLMAPLLESRLSRRELLELYVNRVYFGRSDGYPVFGVYHAAQEFFQKRPEDLTLSESATLVGLLLQPRILDPGRTPGAVGVRRNEVLRRMREAGEIDAAAYRAAVAEPLAFQPGVEYAPMSRPLRWQEPPALLRLPAVTSPAPDSAAIQVP
ncbi:MAG TPA: transglycosylase domain-containing protein [Longimicrobiaceae bacterium]|nr:transglycosylase domain-containing protein [Longimicrobiaceae bacterium]